MSSNKNVWSLPVSSITLPVYFPSISSVKTSHTAADFAEYLNTPTLSVNHYLVSAYDLIRTDEQQAARLHNAMSAAMQSGKTILMDSGNYEAYWKAPTKSWSQEEFHAALDKFPCSIAFGFDEQAPPQDYREHLKLLNERHDKDKTIGNNKVVPIVHADSSILPTMCKQLVFDQNLKSIAVPERRLGDGIFERALSVRALKNALNETGSDVVLHLLGTGNPISIATYSIEGASSFDGLEWCQTVVDWETALLHHFSQADFFRLQTQHGEAKQNTFHSRTFAHNIDFYGDWMKRLQVALSSGDGKSFARSNFPDRIFSQLNHHLGWEAST
jgi:queuine/archaeosine tRNA-ribosyltransferase